MAKLIFITGGVRSGKSAFAENYAKQLHQQLECDNLYYIASGVPFDEEMRERIRRHQQDRALSEHQWKTIEIQEQLEFDGIKANVKSVILWDCITTWLNNVLYNTEQLDVNKRTLEIENSMAKLKRVLTQWIQSGCTVLLVSNEILDEPASIFSEVNLYRFLLGELHQWIVENSDEAYEMDYSRTKQWKG